jgi:hypothetical protein
MGTPHTGELPYVWGYTYLRNNPEVRQQSGINLDLLTGDDDDIPYADYIQTLWTNFAKFGNPTPTPVKTPFNDTSTTWPRYRAEDNHKALYFDTEVYIVENYRQQQYAFFTDYLGYVSGLDTVKHSKPPTDSSSTRKLHQINTQDQKKLRRAHVLDVIKRKAPELYEQVLRKQQENN